MVMRKSPMDMDCPYYKHPGTTSRFQVLEMDPGLLNQVQHRLARDDGNIGPGMPVECGNEGGGAGMGQQVFVGAVSDRDSVAGNVANRSSLPQLSGIN